MFRLSKTTTYVLVALLVVFAAIIGYLIYNRSSKDQYGQVVAPGADGSMPEGLQAMPSSEPTAGNLPLQTLMLFHAHWCGHCKTLMGPQGAWNMVKQALHDTKITVKEIESADPNMAKYGIRGFPTIRFYPNGCSEGSNFVEYHGDRSVQSLINFAKSGGKVSA